MLPQLVRVEEQSSPPSETTVDNQHISRVSIHTLGVAQLYSSPVATLLGGEVVDSRIPREEYPLLARVEKRESIIRCLGAALQKK